MNQINILGIAGSLRRESYNLWLLNAAQTLLPPDTQLQILGLHGIPPFNQDEERNPVAQVTAFKQAVRAADAVLIATPEYNYSIPGVLKNAIDWGTRPYGDNAFAKKPAAIIGASTGSMGTSRAQYHLRQVLTALNVRTINQPELMLTNAADRFDDKGVLTCADTREHLQKVLRALANWTRALQKIESAEAQH